MPLPNPTVDDLVVELRMSNKPNIIVEGKEDACIYRELINQLGIFNIDFLAAGCRQTLLDLYDELSLYETRGDYRHAPVAFIADSDACIFTAGGIPHHYNDIIWTDGYSVENDLYEGARSNLKGLMSSCEQVEYEKTLDTITEWFAFEVEEFLAGRPPEFAHHCKAVLLGDTTDMDPGFQQRRGFRNPTPGQHQLIKSRYPSQLRGKQIFQILVRILSDSKRSAKYSRDALFEIAIKLTKPSHPLMDRLIQEVKIKIPSIP